MKERFKRFLEREFRAIPPTQAAMEYRQEMLGKMLDYAQELRIKGISDEDLIYDMVVDSLGDLRQTLVDFSNKTVKVKKAKRVTLTAIISVVCYVLLLTTAYLVTSFVLKDAWGQTWLIMVGGIFAGIIGGCGVLATVGIKKNKLLMTRASVAVALVLLTVFLFLMLQILATPAPFWLAFLVMVIALFAVDTAIVMITKNKTRFVQLGVTMEIFCVMLYVILGILNVAPWSPTWVLCLVGVLAAAIEALILIGIRNSKKNKDDSLKIKEKHVETNEDYYTMWKD